jgi:hypothetical protein
MCLVIVFEIPGLKLEKNQGKVEDLKKEKNL